LSLTAEGRPHCIAPCVVSSETTDRRLTFVQSRFIAAFSLHALTLLVSNGAHYK